MKRRQRVGATTNSHINPNDFSDDPDYAYHSLSWHAARAAWDTRQERRAEKAARDRGGFDFRARVAA